MLRGTRQITNRQEDIIVTGPSVEPVLLDELKRHLRIPLTDYDQDTYIKSTIVAARQEIEQVTGFAFITQTWKLLLDMWPGERDPWWDGVRVGSINQIHGASTAMQRIEPLKYPLVSVDSLTVYDDEGVSGSVVVADVFDIDTSSWPGRISLKRGATWPIALQSINSIEFGYTAGFGATAADVDEVYKRAIRTMAAWLYDNRGTGCSVGDAYYDSGAAMLLNKFKRRRI